MPRTSWPVERGRGLMNGNPLSPSGTLRGETPSRQVATNTDSPWVDLKHGSRDGHHFVYPADDHDLDIERLARMASVDGQWLTDTGRKNDPFNGRRIILARKFELWLVGFIVFLIGYCLLGPAISLPF